MVYAFRQRRGRQTSPREACNTTWYEAPTQCSTHRRVLTVSGSSPSTQRDFLEVLANENRKPQQKGQRSRAPVSNEFALGYTYLDVLDADHEGQLQ